MGYPRGLDEYTDIELALEIERRQKLRAAGKCDYCTRDISLDSCMFPERHNQDKRKITPGPQKRA